MTVTLPKVRGARPEDYPAVMRLCESLYQENGLTRVAWKRVEEAVINGINGQRAALGVIGQCDDLGGIILLRLSECWYSDDLLLEELYNYVPPHHRNGHNARWLSELAKAASIRPASPLLIAVLSTHRAPGKVRFNQRGFCVPAGAFFVYGRMIGGN